MLHAIRQTCIEAALQHHLICIYKYSSTVGKSNNIFKDKLYVPAVLRTLRSMISCGRSNSCTMHRGMAPPHGCRQQQKQNRTAREQQQQNKDDGEMLVPCM